MDEEQNGQTTTPPPPPDPPGGSAPPPPASPPPGPPAAPSEPAGNPWERRDDLGFGAALIGALKVFITNPVEAFRQTKRSGDLASPLIFAVLVGWAAAIVGQIWGLLFQGSLLTLLPPEAREGMGMFLTTGVASFLVAVILAPIFIVIGLFIWSGILHGCLLLLGGTESSDAGFEGTLRTASYSYVSSLAQVVPIIGGLIAIVWTIVLHTIGLSTIHRTSQGKALGAVFLPLGICCLCGVIFALLAGAGGLFAGLMGN